MYVHNQKRRIEIIKKTYKNVHAWKRDLQTCRQSRIEIKRDLRCTCMKKRPTQETRKGQQRALWYLPQLCHNIRIKKVYIFKDANKRNQWTRLLYESLIAQIFHRIYELLGLPQVEAAHLHLTLYCNILQRTATNCNTHCNKLHQTASHCNTLQHTATH